MFSISDNHGFKDFNAKRVRLFEPDHRMAAFQTDLILVLKRAELAVLVQHNEQTKRTKRLTGVRAIVPHESRGAVSFFVRAKNEDGCLIVHHIPVLVTGIPVGDKIKTYVGIGSPRSEGESRHFVVDDFYHHRSIAKILSKLRHILAFEAETVAVQTIVLPA